ncbi:MAG TPA: hypothetical protein VJ180_01245, partial [Pyrinomonadaceae bacterium]|nr:hypothetical protein [Pyrinomonadaceae bacterium]
MIQLRDHPLSARAHVKWRRNSEVRLKARRYLVRSLPMETGCSVTLRRILTIPNPTTAVSGRITTSLNRSGWNTGGLRLGCRGRERNNSWQNHGRDTDVPDQLTPAETCDERRFTGGLRKQIDR